MSQSADRQAWYGWVVVALAALAMVGTLPGRTHGLGYVTEPLLADLALSPATYGWINLWATLIGALFCLPCGMLLDRFGARAVWLWVTSLLGILVIAMSQVQTWLWLLIAVTLTRGFGQSMLSVVSLTIIGKAFTQRLSLAMGAYTVLMGLGFGLAAKVVTDMVKSHDWRWAWCAIGVAVLCGLAPLGILLRRRLPGETQPSSDNESALGQSTSPDMSLNDALRTACFWVFALGTSIYGLVTAGISLFYEAILAERGFDREVFYQVVTITPLIGMASNLVCGALAMRWPLKRLLAIALALIGICLLALPHLRTQPQLYLYAAAWGVGGGMVTVIFFSIWAQAFGRTHLGKVQGAAQMLTVVASAIGPLLLGACKERTGSYIAVFQGLAVIVAVLAVCAWVVRMPDEAVASEPRVEPIVSS